MASALIGYTGFVGSTLLTQTEFTNKYNSKNIEEIKGKHFDFIICAGAPAVKWKANQNPEEDLLNLQGLMNCLDSVKADLFILISTVDVYRNPDNVDEDSVIDAESTDPYGKHRYALEQYVREKFLNHKIIRLPGLFGKGLKKNFIYDLMNDNCLHLTHHKSVFQFYDMSLLWDDIQRVSKHNWNVVNFAAEPISAEEVAKYCFDKSFDTVTERSPMRYNMKSKYASTLSSNEYYLYTKEEVISQIRSLVKEESGSV